MEKPIYYNQVRFYVKTCEEAYHQAIYHEEMYRSLGLKELWGVISLNLTEKEISLQIYERSKVRRKSFCKEGNMPTSSKTCEWGPEKVLFSFGKSIKDKLLLQIMPLCNACDFEPYRNKHTANSDCYGSIRKFIGVTESYLPVIELPVVPDWPTDKLYRFLINDVFRRDVNTKEWVYVLGPYGFR